MRVKTRDTQRLVVRLGNSKKTGRATAAAAAGLPVSRVLIL